MSSRHNDRVSKISSEPGTFVYDGTSEAIEHIPTAMRVGKNEPVLDEDGLPVVDKNGEQVFQKAGGFKRGPDGNPVLGGVPKEVRVNIPSRKFGKLEFLPGKPVLVENGTLARKLRCLQGFSEVESVEVVEADLSTMEGLLTLDKPALLDLADKSGAVVDGRAKKEVIAEAILEARK